MRANRRRGDGTVADTPITYRVGTGSNLALRLGTF